MKTVLVTGGGGYIGTTLVPFLIEQGYEVRVLDRLHFGREMLPPDSSKLRVVQGDIRFESAAIFEGIDAVIDLAALSNDPLGELDPIQTHSINHLGRQRMAALAKASGVQRYILPSSCSIYGFQDGTVDETSPVNPLTSYAKANRAAENDLLVLSGGDFCGVIIRQATVYGLSKRMRFDLAVNGMVKGYVETGKIPILKDGTQWRPFVHVRDASKAMLLLLQADAKQIQGEIFNIGSDDQNYQILDLARRVAAAMEVPFEFEWYGQPDHRSYQVSFAKARHVLGYTPDWNAEKGAREIAAALESGSVKGSDPKTNTLGWYKHLVEQGVMI